MDELKKIYNEKVIDYENDFNWKLAECVPKNKKILDVGCATGNMGKYLIEQKGATVYGLDISSKAIQQASKVLNKAVCLNIEKKSVPFKELFDVILFGDVLEHLFDPMNMLKKIKKNLKKNGLIICSIPNIANIEIRLSLLLGNFDYSDFGILDRSHIRFFTLKTIKQMFQQLDYTIEKIDYFPFSFILFREKYAKKYPFLRKIKYKLASINPRLFANTFIIVAKNEK